jgi:hypothetical protein
MVERILLINISRGITDVAQHTPYQGLSMTGYIRTGTGVKQTEVDCELTNGALSSRYYSTYLINDLPPVSYYK